jgi:hypothetical protein
MTTKAYLSNPWTKALIMGLSLTIPWTCLIGDTANEAVVAVLAAVGTKVAAMRVAVEKNLVQEIAEMIDEKTTGLVMGPEKVVMDLGTAQGMVQETAQGMVLGMVPETVLGMVPETALGMVLKTALGMVLKTAQEMVPGTAREMVPEKIRGMVQKMVPETDLVSEAETRSTNATKRGVDHQDGVKQVHLKIARRQMSHRLKLLPQ